LSARCASSIIAIRLPCPLLEWWFYDFPDPRTEPRAHERAKTPSY